MKNNSLKNNTIIMKNNLLKNNTYNNEEQFVKK